MRFIWVVLGWVTVASLAHPVVRAVAPSSLPAGVRAVRLEVPTGNAEGFTALEPASLGITFTNALPAARKREFQNLMNGCGVAAGDIDHDGRVDLYFCHRAGPNALFRNLGGGRFEDITATAGVACTNLSSSGAVFADLDGDGHLDLLVSSFGGPHACFRGDGKGRFTDVTAASGISAQLGGTSLALGDLDGDGDLDLYWCNFGTLSPLRDGVQLSERMVNGVPTVTGRWARKVRIIGGRYWEFGDPDTLYRNEGSGRFVAVPFESAFVDEDGRPVETPWDFGLAVQVRDINGDGHPDIYVCNDFQTPDRMWLGDGRGKFRAVPRGALRNMSYASMGVDFADLDRDGHLDFFTVEMLNRDHGRFLRTMSSREAHLRSPGPGEDREEFTRNALYWNRGDGTWAEIASFAGVAATDWSWTPLFLDVDLDGWEDLLVSNGHLHDVNDRDVNASLKKARATVMRGNRDALDRYPAQAVPKAAFRNRRNLTFEDAAGRWRFDSRRIAHGMVTADLDGDGDLDVVLNCLDGPPLVYRNEATAPRVAVRLKGRAPNTGAVGARVTLRGGPVDQTQEVLAGGQYLSGSDPRRVFAAGAGPMKLEIRWRNGRRSVVEGVVANHLYEIDEAQVASEESGPPAAVAAGPTWFTEVRDAWPHRHAEDAADDLAQEPLAVRRHGWLGPGLAMADVDGDGNTDAVVGASARENVRWYRGDGRGGLAEAGALANPFPADTAGPLVVRTSTNATWLVLGSLDASEGIGPRVTAFQWKATNWVAGPVLVPDPKEWAVLPGRTLAAADVDGDGRVEFFLGGLRRDGQGEGRGRSCLWNLTGTGWVQVREVEVGYSVAGRVQASVFADFDGDGTVELATAGEWGAVTVASTGPGSKALDVPRQRGWWQSLAAGDFDGDGKLDLAAGNWGLNSRWAIWGDGRPRAYLGDFEGNGVPLVLEAWAGPGDSTLRPWRDLETLATAWPSLRSRFPTHESFAEATAEQVLGPARAAARLVSTDTLASHVFLQRGEGFSPEALPGAAQWSPVFGLAVADFDGDGREDLFLGQNDSGVRPEDDRLDAAQGLVLRRDGKSGWEAVGGRTTGLRLSGNLRAAAVADLNRDGRPDLLVTENGAASHALLNRVAAEGVRLLIRGPAGNPDGLGGTLRLEIEPGRFLVRAIGAGGGFHSQAADLLVPSGGKERRGEVIWPGGRRQSFSVKPDQREIRLEAGPATP